MRTFTGLRNRMNHTLKRKIIHRATSLPLEQQRMIAVYALGLRDGFLLWQGSATLPPEDGAAHELPAPSTPTEPLKG